MSLTENSDQVFLPGGCNRTQNLRFGPYTISSCVHFIASFKRVYETIIPFQNKSMIERSIIMASHFTIYYGI